MFKNNNDIKRIGEGIVACTLPKADWTHAAHFAAAAWLLERPEYDAFKDMPDIIRRYNEATGIPNTDTEGYHETINLASLRAIRAFLNSADRPIFETVNSFLASRYGRSEWILDYWSRDVLFSTIARRNWVEPDKQPLPF